MRHWLIGVAAGVLWAAFTNHGLAGEDERLNASTREVPDSSEGEAQVLGGAALVVISSGTGILMLTDPLNRVSGPVDSLNTIPHCRRENSDVDVGYPLGIIEISDPVTGIYTVNILSTRLAMVAVSGMWVSKHHHSCGDAWVGEKGPTDNAPLTFRFSYQAVGDGDSCMVRILEQD